MEVEIKFRVPEDFFEALKSDPLIIELSGGSGWKEGLFEAIYYDTLDLSLLKAGMAYRVRREGGKYVAAVKANTDESSHLQKRMEWSAVVGSFMPDISLFFGTEIGADLKSAVGGKELRELFTCRFKRHSIVLMSGGRTVFEAALDEGEISSGCLSEPLSELEMELKEGSLSDMLQVSSALKEKYGLVPEKRSKFRRGVDLYMRRSRV